MCDDPALFSAAAARLAVAAALGAGKTGEAESERAVAKRCVKLACGVLALPFPSKSNKSKVGPGGSDGGKEEGKEDEEDSEEEGSEDEDEAVAAEAEKQGEGGMGPLAGSAAALVLGHVMFSPATRAVARAALNAVKRNAHPALAGLRTQAGAYTCPLSSSNLSRF